MKNRPSFRSQSSGLLLVQFLLLLDTTPVSFATTRLGLVNPEACHGGEIRLRVTITNDTAQALDLSYPATQLELPAWLERYGNQVRLRKTGAGEVPLLINRKGGRQVKSFPTIVSISSVAGFTYEVNLRDIFRFPPEEVGRYRLDWPGGRHLFELKPVPDLVCSDRAYPVAEDFQGVEYAVTARRADAESSRLLAREFNEPFREILRLPFRPLALRAWKLERVPGLPGRRDRWARLHTRRACSHARPGLPRGERAQARPNRFTPAAPRRLLRRSPHHAECRG